MRLWFSEAWSVWQVNAAISVGSLAVAVFGVLLPWILFRRGAQTVEGQERYNLGLSIGNMLSAGVMMSASLVHLLAEANKTLEKTGLGDGKLPWAMILCGVGFIFTLVIAQLLEPGSEQIQCVDCNSDCRFSMSLTVSPGSAILSKGLSGNFERHMWHDLPLDHSTCSHDGQGSLIHRPIGINSHHNTEEVAEHLPHHTHGHGHIHGHYCQQPDRCETGAGASATHPASALDSPLLPKAPIEIAGSSFVLATGLAVHSVIEGTAIGAQGAREASLKIAVAVLAHKGLTGYAIGTSLLNPAVTQTQFVAFLVLFSLSTPFGILVGSLVSAELEGAAWAAGVSATASGTFLYSAVVEVLGNEMRQECFSPDSVHRRTYAKVFKISAFIVGFAAMCVVSQFT
mmetsp:Transcript_11376/g.32312  ORF Transcript_11376/g.32312 Transcript_11376/m.32312 type:complete len:399 (+) Transcript_11376:375-1571(+)|eukprot:CAMPEP_0117684770 /NCGR_PEP_ID=MMETSP0804-20121206/21314_1 /TAXON_ID=1074897 /ORGANISM="Tetraselmis astigmatica, Strain CCMP880" /LENGTH=398 /DNA_ID=CAMNT_0005495859 /DNA_START=306 /DNA_END=1502 /DNA_ORIENTATION=+